MTIEEFSGTVPSSTDTDNFDARADAAWAWLVSVVPQINDAIALMNLNSLESTSTTSLAIGTGSKSATAQTGKSFYNGMWVIFASAANVANFMVGQVTSYNSGTGALVVTIHFKNGSGTYADWRISIAAARNLEVTDDEIYVITPNGQGSTYTLARRWTTAVVNNGGTSMTYADSATLGGSVTINEAGIYAMSALDQGGGFGGITKNHTTGLDQSSANTLVFANTDVGMSVTTKLAASDVIRFSQTSASGLTSGRAYLRIKRIL